MPHESSLSLVRPPLPRVAHGFAAALVPKVDANTAMSTEDIEKYDGAIVMRGENNIAILGNEPFLQQLCEQEVLELHSKRRKRDNTEGGNYGLVYKCISRDQWNKPSSGLRKPLRARHQLCGDKSSLINRKVIGGIGANRWATF